MFAERCPPPPDGKNSHLTPLQDSSSGWQNRSVASGQQRPVGYALTGLSLVAIGIATLTPSSGQSFARACIICGSYGTTDAVLNVILFAPLGIGLCLSGVSVLRSLAIACALSISIELAQLFVIPGRDATVGDVVMNTVGASLGFIICLKWKVWVAPEPRTAARLAFGWGFGWLFLQALSSWALVPSYPSSRYYGEIAPSLAGFAVFDGAVRNPRIGEINVPDSPMPSTNAVRATLSMGGALSAVASPVNLGDDVAPVVRIADDRQREIAMLGLRRGDLVLRVRTVAALLRLRPPTFALGIPGRDSINPGSALTISGLYRPPTVTLQSTSSGWARAADIAVSLALGWTLFVPFEYFIRSGLSENILGSLWIAFFLLPFGYWGGRWSARRGQNERGARIAIAACVQLLVVVAGLAGVPLLFGLKAVPLAVFLLGMFALTVGHYSAILWTNRSK